MLIENSQFFKKDAVVKQVEISGILINHEVVSVK